MNELGQGIGDGDHRAECFHCVSPAGFCRPLLLSYGYPGGLVQVAIESLQGSSWLLKLGGAVEQPQQADGREFGDITAQ